MTKDYVSNLQFFDLYLFLWRHLLTSSVRLFNVVLGSAVKMEYFRLSIVGIVCLLAGMALRGKQCSTRWWVYSRRLCRTIRTWKARFRCFFGGDKGLLVIVISCFKFRFTETKVIFGLVIAVYGGFVNETLISAPSRHGARCLSAVARRWIWFISFLI